MDQNFYFNLEMAISDERLSHYSKIFQTKNKKVLIQKYLLNIKISKSLYAPIQNLEITLRNNIHNVLSINLNNEFWFEDELFLGNRIKSKIIDAKNKIHKNKELTSGRIISELSFGFWTCLLSKEYEQIIWNKYTKKIFPNIPRQLATRRNISREIQTIRNLRNKVFHFDTVINIKNLTQIHKKIFEIIYWLNKDVYSLTLELDDFQEKYLNEEKIIKSKLDNLIRS